MSSDLWIPDSLDGFAELWKWIQSLRDKSLDKWTEVMRWYSLHSLFFLVNFVLSDGRKIHSQTKKLLHFHDYYLKLCNDTQYALDNCLSSFCGDARGSGKSTIRTKAGSIYLILNNPNISICIFSCERQLAKRHQGTVNAELEQNKLLQVLFPDVLFDDPRGAAKDGAAVWSREDGIRVKRDIVRTNNTLENHAFMGSTPTGSRFDVLIFDDCESERYVSTSDALNKLHDSYNQAIALATAVVVDRPIVMTTNTLYHSEGVAHKQYLKYKTIDPRLARLYPGEDLNVPGDGPLGGTPMYPFTKESLEFWYESLGKDKTSYASQFCCNFTAASDRSFKRDWLTFSDMPARKMAAGTNAYVNIDASRGIEDPMFIWVWGAAPEKKYRWIDGSRKKLDPASPSFHDEIFNVVSRNNNLCNRVIEVRVEQLPNQTWADLIASELRRRGCHVPVVACKGKVIKSGKFSTAKLEREWQRWSPPLQRGEIVFPKPTSMGGEGIRTVDEKGRPFDLVDYFLSMEYDMFPRSPNDDGLDSGALMFEPETSPVQWPPFRMQRNDFMMTSFNRSGSGASWMSGG